MTILLLLTIGRRRRRGRQHLECLAQKMQAEANALEAPLAADVAMPCQSSKQIEQPRTASSHAEARERDCRDVSSRSLPPAKASKARYRISRSETTVPGIQGKKVDVQQNRLVVRNFRRRPVEKEKRDVDVKVTAAKEIIDGYIDHSNTEGLRCGDIDKALFGELAKDPKQPRRIAEAHNGLASWLLHMIYRENYREALCHSFQERTDKLVIGCVFGGPIIDMLLENTIGIMSLGTLRSLIGKFASADHV